MSQPTFTMCATTRCATNPAEFFAVISEVFFERPREMASLYPALYAELSSLYRVDPASW